jgi:hypothetical protein
MILTRGPLNKDQAYDTQGNIWHLVDRENNCSCEPGSVEVCGWCWGHGRVTPTDRAVPTGHYWVHGDPERDPRNAMCEAVENVTVMDTDVVYVCAWVLTREYGGPEEGGWWYDAGDLQASVPSSQTNAEVVKQRLQEELAHLDCGRPISSVLHSGSLRVAVQDEPGASYPDRRPHYE